MAFACIILFTALWINSAATIPVPFREGDMESSDVGSTKANFPLESLLSAREGRMTALNLPLRLLTIQEGRQQTAGPLTPQFQSGNEYLGVQPTFNKKARTSMDMNANFLSARERGPNGNDGSIGDSSAFQTRKYFSADEKYPRKLAWDQDSVAPQSLRNSLTDSQNIPGNNGKLSKTGPFRYQTQSLLSTPRRVEPECQYNRGNTRTDQQVGSSRLPWLLNTPENSSNRAVNFGYSEPLQSRLAMSNLITEENESQKSLGDTASRFEKLLREKDPSILHGKIPIDDEDDPYVPNLTNEFQITPPKQNMDVGRFEFTSDFLPRGKLLQVSKMKDSEGRASMFSPSGSKRPSYTGLTYQNSADDGDLPVPTDQLQEILKQITMNEDFANCDVTAECNDRPLGGASDIPNYNFANYLRHAGMENKQLQSSHRLTTQGRLQTGRMYTNSNADF